MNVGRKMGICMGVLNGLVLGGTFSGIGAAKGMLNSPMHHIIVPALIRTILISALISAVISAVIGCFVSVKGISDMIAGKLKIDEFANPIKFGFITAFVGDLVMTPILCFVFVAKNVGFTPALLPAYFSSLVMDLAIALVITFILGKPFNMISKKISGIR